MKLLVSEQWFQGLVKEARRVAGWPPGGFKLGDKSLLEKKKGWTNFLPAVRLEEDPERHKRFNEILCEIIDQGRLPEHFRFHIKGYILFNYINAPATNFVIQSRHLSKGRRPLPVIKPFGVLQTNDLRLAKTRLNNWLHTMKLPPLLAKAFKPKNEKTLERDLKIEKESKKKEIVEEFDESEYKAVHRKETDEDVVRKVLGTDETLEDMRKKKSVVKQARKRISEAKKKRGWR